MAELGEGLSGYLDVQDATLRAPRLEAVSNIGIANTAPQHAFSVGSNLYIDTESSNVLTVDGNVVCEGVKVGLIEIIPSYDLAAVSNVGNVTQSTIQFSNATTGFVTTANIEVGTANLFVDTVSGRVGIGTNSPVSGLTVSKDIESTNSFITERVLFKETWPNGLNSLVGDLGTWVVTNLNQQTSLSSATTPDGYGIVAFKGVPADNGEFVSPAFDLSDYALSDGVLPATNKRKTTTRVFLKCYFGTRNLSASGEVAHVQFSPDNGSTWYTVATSQDEKNTDRFTMVSADLSPYILETSTNAKIRFYMPWSVAGGDYMRIGRIWIHESDVPTNLGGMWLGAGGNIGIGTTSPSAKLQVGGNAETDPQYLWIRGNRVNEAGEISGIHFYNSLNSGDRGNSRIINSRGTNNYGSNLEFWTNPDDNVPATQKMTILANGNVGIGKADPLFNLDIGSNTARISGVTNYVKTASSVGTSTYVYIGRFTTYGTASVSFTATGNSSFSANYATFIRHYDQIPTVSYLLQGDIYTTHQFYYQIADVYAYDVWHRQTSLPGLTITYYVSGAAVSLSGEPAVTNRLQFPYGYIATQGASAGISKHGFTGSVGVGKTNPTVKLDINAGSSSVNIQGPNQGNSGGPNNDPWTGLTFTRIGTSGETYNGQVNLRTYRWKTSGADPAMALTFNLSSTQPYNSADIMTLKSDNKVGIGTTNPNNVLEVVGSINCASIRLGTGSTAGHQKKIGLNNGNVSFNFPLRLVCNWSPGIIKIKAAMNDGNGGDQYAWHWTVSFRALDCSGPTYDLLTTIEGSNPGATFFEHSMNSNGQLTLTALAGGRDNVVAECEVIHYQGIYNN